MEHITFAAQWTTSKFFGIMQTLNSQNAEAKQTLENEGVKVLGKYSLGNENPTAEEVKELILSFQQPFQTLEVVGVCLTIAFYVGRQITPWPLNWISTACMLASAYSTYQITQVNDEINREYYHFDRLKKKEVTREEFLDAAQHLANNILSKSALMRTVTSADSTESYRNLGKVVGKMIGAVETEKGAVKSEESKAAVWALIKDYRLVNSLFNIVIPT